MYSKFYRMAATVAACALMSACVAQKTKYDWAGYDQALYDYYKHPADAAEYMKALKGAIDNADHAHQRTAPTCSCSNRNTMMLRRISSRRNRHGLSPRVSWTG
jgi:hypothetical protein